MKKLVLCLTAVLLASCAATIPNEEKVGSVEQLYNDGMDLLTKGYYPKAINTFEELERQHPYSAWAVRAELMKIFTYYQMNEYQEVFAQGDTFIRNHPGHDEVPYVLYLEAMSHYEQIKDIKRDQQPTLEALKSFQELIQRFPNSTYARDARLKVTLCKSHLAAKEVQIGRYYQEHDRLLAAINRYRFVVDTYETTAHAQEALYRLTESYLALGIVDEAQASAAVLGYNYPNSVWYQDAYKLLTDKHIKPVDYVEERSTLGKIWDGVEDAVGIESK